jgi:hypothetical protein
MKTGRKLRPIEKFVRNTRHKLWMGFCWFLIILGWVSAFAFTTGILYIAFHFIYKYW